MSAPVARDVRGKPRPFEIEFQGGGGGAIHLPGERAGLALPLKLLAGNAVEQMGDDVRQVGEAHGFRLFAGAGLWIGCAVWPRNGTMEATAFELYRHLLRAAEGYRLYRLWNHVPAITRISAGVENYRGFNIGRARAFDEAWGPDFGKALPAASAVGSEGEELAAVFIAGDREPRYFENPEQVPAYRYPSDHGPRSPSFSRAAAVGGAGRRRIYISGTSAIKGHVTVSPGSTAGQVDCTVDNLRLIAREAGAGEEVGGALGLERWFRIYLRHASDVEAVSARLQSSLLRPGDHAVWLQADLCRSALNIEIDATLLGRPVSP